MSRDPLTGPFMTSSRLTDYREMPGYAIRAGGVPEGVDFVADALARIGRSSFDSEADRLARDERKD